MCIHDDFDYTSTKISTIHLRHFSMIHPRKFRLYTHVKFDDTYTTNLTIHLRRFRLYTHDNFDDIPATISTIHPGKVRQYIHDFFDDTPATISPIHPRQIRRYMHDKFRRYTHDNFDDTPKLISTIHHRSFRDPQKPTSYTRPTHASSIVSQSKVAQLLDNIFAWMLSTTGVVLFLSRNVSPAASRIEIRFKFSFLRISFLILNTRGYL